MSSATNISICREGWYFLVVLAFIIGGAIVREVNLLFVLAGLMVGPLLVSWRMAAVTLRDLRFTRKFPESVSAGEPLLIELAVANERPHVDSWGLVVQDHIERVGEGTFEPIDVDVRVPHLAAGTAEREAYQGSLLRRGRYRLGPLTVRTRYPLGLIEGSLVEESYDDLIVSPRLGRLTAAWRRVLQRSRSGSEQAAHRQGSIEGEFYGIRDWQSGDSQRWVHWRTSARRNKLAVRQFELQHRPDLAIVLDLVPGQLDDEGLSPVVERAISFAATIVTDTARRSTGRIVLVIAGRELVIRSGSASTNLVKEMTEALAVAEAADYPQLAAALRESGRNVPPGTTTVLITTRGPDRLVEELTERGPGELTRGPLVTIDALGREIDEYFLAQEGQA